jgi:ribosomal protein S13
VERARDPSDLVVGLREEMTEVRTTVAQLATVTNDMRHEFRADIRRLDGRLFQIMLVQLGTLATALTAIAVALIR